MNDHHETAFRRAFPRVYALAFELRPARNALTRLESDGVHDLNVMKGRYRNSHEQLVSLLTA